MFATVRARGQRIAVLALAGALFGVACGGKEEAPPKAPDTAQVSGEAAEAASEPAKAPEPAAEAEATPAAVEAPAAAEPAPVAVPEPEKPASAQPSAAAGSKPSAAKPAPKPAKPPKPAAAAEAVAPASYDGPEPCEGKSFSVPAVRAACAKGGRAQAKLVMKQAISNARAAGTSLKCGDCHVDQKSFKLKPDAAKDLRHWLEG